MGGILLVVILAIVSEKLIFQRVFDDPLKGKMTSVAVAYVVSTLLVGWSGPGGFNTMAIALNMIPTAIVGTWFYHRGMQLREELNWPDGADPDLQKTFD